MIERASTTRSTLSSNFSIPSNGPTHGPILSFVRQQISPARIPAEVELVPTAQHLMPDCTDRYPYPFKIRTKERIGYVVGAGEMHTFSRIRGSSSTRMVYQLL